VKAWELGSKKAQLTTKEIIHTVEKARLLQKQRFQGSKVHRNAEMSNSDIDKFANISEEARQIAITSTEKLHLSTRVYYRILRVARTIADISESSEVQVPHILEAFSYRWS
jgi:magnesium chelatase family protein